MIILKTGQDADFVESVFNFLFSEVRQFDLLERVDLLISQPFDFKYCGVCSLTYMKPDLPSFAPISKSFSDMLIIIIIELLDHPYSHKSHTHILLFLQTCHNLGNPLETLVHYKERSLKLELTTDLQFLTALFFVFLLDSSKHLLKF